MAGGRRRTTTRQRRTATPGTGSVTQQVRHTWSLSVATLVSGPLSQQRRCLVEDLSSDGDRVADVGFRNVSTCVGGGVSPLDEPSLIVRTGEGLRRYRAAARPQFSPYSHRLVIPLWSSPTEQEATPAADRLNHEVEESHDDLVHHVPGLTELAATPRQPRRR